MPMGIVRVDASLLRHLLHLPADAVIVDVQSAFDIGAIDFKVMHPDLKESLPGNAILRANPQIGFLGWGQ